MEICPAFVDETGVLTGSLTTQPVYGIGLLLVEQPQLVTDPLYELHFNFGSTRASRRSQMRRAILDDARVPTLGELDRLMWATRHHEYKFSEVTKHNLQQYIDLLNLYFSLPGFGFHSVLVDRLDPEFSLATLGDGPWAGYLSLAKELLKRRLNRMVFAIVDLQGKPKEARLRLEEVVCSVPNVEGCLRATSDMSVFLQLVDVLLGCVQFDWKDQHNYYGAGSRRAEAKRDLTTFVKARLGLRPEEPILSGDRNFLARRIPLTFMAWRFRPSRSLKKKSAAMSGVHPANGTT